MSLYTEKKFMYAIIYSLTCQQSKQSSTFLKFIANALLDRKKKAI